MSIRVRHPGTDLFPEGVVEILDGEHYQIEDDNTVTLYDAKDNIIGHIRRTRWDSVVLTDEPAAKT